MLKLQAVFVAAALGLAGSAAGATVLGPDAAVCQAGTGPAILVHIVGLKNRAGTIRVRTFGGNPATWFDKKTYLKRVVIPTPNAGNFEICMPVARPGTYAVDLRHDVNNNSDTDMEDGGGASGNPDVSLFDVVFNRKPPASKTGFQVSTGVTSVTVVMKYKSGASFKPIAQLQTTRR
jgi:uncharacterized protein (DUF2141 family)